MPNPEEPTPESEEREAKRLVIEKMFVAAMTEAMGMPPDAKLTEELKARPQCKQPTNLFLSAGGLVRQ
jgi:hypothetical protein